ncbi:LysR family transcriptional regulator [Tomitella biformata]|uniref:LysR family transcriptional regulator n=1 Tax=Tomitella biformata TaxID=630403 RepID=UPI0004BBB267|nr:LysR family transcriptional regulator [Tomitella biformata]
MEFRQLRYFLAVGEMSSFSRAAERCYISQSAISHQISKLERELGASLFERSTRVVSLTPAGERLMPIAAEVLALEAKALAVGREPRNRIRVTANMSFAAQSLDAIATVREQHPNLDIEFVIKDFADRMDAVVSGDADLALIRGEVDRPGVETVDLGNQDLLILLSRRHPLATRDRVDLGELAEFPLLLPPRHQQVLIHQVIEGAFREIGRKALLGPAIPADHTAPLEVITHPRAWTVLYPESAIGMPPAGVRVLSEARDRLRVPVRAVLRTGMEPGPGLQDLLTALRP